MTRHKFALTALLALLGAAIALAVASAQTSAQTSTQTGSVDVRITARKAADGSVEMCLYLNTEKTRRCPAARYFPYPNLDVNEWRASSAVQVGRAALSIRARRAAGGWVELTLAAALDGETRTYRPERRFLNWSNAVVDRWLRSTSVTVEIGGCAGATGLADRTSRLQRGRAAPDFAIERFEGGCAVSLSELRGRTVLLVFWSSWDGAGGALLERLDRLWRARGGEDGDLAVLAINAYDTRGAAASAFVRTGAGFPGAIDAQNQVAYHYRIDGLPELLLIDSAGVYRERITGAADLSVITAAIDRAGGALR